MTPDPEAARIARLLELSCDWIWATDGQHRLCRLDGRHLAAGPNPLLAQLGKAPWEWPGVVDDGGAEPGPLRDALLKHRHLDDVHYAFRDRRGHLRYMAVCGEPTFASSGVFDGYRGTMRDVTQRKRVEALNELEHRVTRGLAEAATSRKIMQAVMQVICEAEQWQTAGFFRVEDPQGTTRLVVGWSGPGTLTRAAEYYKQTADKVIPAGGLLSQVAQSGQPLWVEAMKASQTTWVQRVNRTGERATLFCPVSVDGQVIGIFAFASREVREPDSELLRTMRVIGEQVGQFLKRKQAERVLRESEARFRALTQLSSDWYWETDTEFRFTRIEGEHAEAGSRAGGDLLGRARWDIGLVCEEAGGWSAHRAKLDERLPFRDLVLMRPLAERNRRYVSISGEPMLDRHGAFLGYRGVGRDITQRKLAENHVQHLATHDGLTGLPNRMLFTEQLELALRFAGRNRRKIGVLFIDIDAFKTVNDACGHDAGDALLKEMAQRFTLCLRASDVVARLGGDEFVALLQEVDSDDDVAAIAAKILASAARPVFLEGRQYHVTVSIGISMYDDDADDEQSLMRHADMAMYQAKHNGKNTFHFFVPPARAEGRGV